MELSVIRAAVTIDAMIDSVPGNVILLNGSSSAGKTTLAKMLQTLLPQPYQHIALDQFRDGLPDAYRGLNSPQGTPGADGLNVVPAELNGEPVTRIEFGDHGARVLAAMRRSIAQFSQLGVPVVVDDLLFKQAFLADYADSLAQCPVWCVGVFCEVWRINEREAARPGRFPGTAQAQLAEIHGHGMVYDITVDTTYDSAHDCALQIVAGLEQQPTALDTWRRQYQPTTGE